jgi:hypothetical protein
MQRRTFIRNSSLAAGATLAFPTLGAALNVFQEPVNQKAKHVVYCMLGGGVRMNETIEQQSGCLMPNLFRKTHSACANPDWGFDFLPAVLPEPLSASGILYPNFTYASGPISHYNAALASLCGKYFENVLDYRIGLIEDSIFDYYNRSCLTRKKKNNAVWIPNALSKYTKVSENEHACSYHNYHSQNLSGRQERARLYFSELPQPRINEDLRCIAAAAESIQNHQPELLVFNLQGADICHSNYSAYCENLHLADYGLGRLWQTIQITPGMANNTVLIVAPEHGRDQRPNSISDGNNLFGYDHVDEVDARNMFCLIAGPAEIIAHNRVSNYFGESIDILPSIAHLLGFENELTHLPGKNLVDGFTDVV